ncbi:MAG: hypothetical protein P1P86_03665 [Bacteroidales bacterium]|nr:hypothetical protein [Bacteroidales bacterium]
MEKKSEISPRERKALLRKMLVRFSFLPLVFALRILNEEKVLKENPEGYKKYCQKIRYRLIPGIW